MSNGVSKCLRIVLGLSATLLPTIAQTAAPGASQTQVAIIDGQPIFESDLLPLIEAQMRQLRNQEYELKSKALDNLINQKLLDADARKNSAALQRYLEQYSTEPTDGEVEAYYAGQKDRLNRPFDDVRPQLRQALKQA